MPQPRRARAGKPQHPGSIVTQAQVTAEELARIEYLRTRCSMKQAANEHDDDEPYAPAFDSGERLSYKEYLKALGAYERRVKDITPPAALRLAQKHLAEAAKQVA